jgi:hypothetical protein
VPQETELAGDYFVGRVVPHSSATARYQQHHLSLAFVHKDGENWKQFPAWAFAADDEGAHGGQLVPSLRL